jgi:glycosyltransferase involved in cell wall biosynthesis
MRVLAFARYGPRAASTRQRLLQYIPALHAAGIEVEHHALLPDDYVQGLVTGEPYPPWRLVGDYARRVRQLRSQKHFDLLWIYADLFPYVPAPVERLILGNAKPVVYDLDDAFFHHYDDSPNPMVRGLLRDKFESLLSRATACNCGNSYVRDYAARYCGNSVILPTVVDTSIYRPVRNRASGPLVIGWIGSPTTWPNVRPLLPLLARLCADKNVFVRVVGAGPLAEQDRFPGLELVEWNEATEIAEVQRMDIGIMPLIDRRFERGKSGYKLIQYMACGLPVVASPVGVNRDIVREGVNGFLATDESEWRNALVRLIADPGLRSRLGGAGRAAAEAHYSLASQAPRLIEVLKAAASANLAPAPPQ